MAITSETKTLKKGSVLIAKNRCKMDYGREQYTLTIGKEYVITYINKRKFEIIDDERSQHDYTLDTKDDSYWKKFFKLKKD